MILVSACLCGVNCKYNGKNNLHKEILKLLEEGKAIIACPEQLGGLTTPRIPCEISGGTGADVLDGNARVIAKDTCEDLTEQFIKGAYEALRIAKDADISCAVLKSNSPSCGFKTIYNGNFDGTLIAGNGVTAELFRRNGITIKSEKDY